MFRLAKILTLTLAVAAASLVTISCAISNQAQIRVINAVSDSPPLDIYFNGTKAITNMPFGAVMPDTSPASYTMVNSGTYPIQGFATGTRSNPVAPGGIITLNSFTQYTLVAVGLALNNSLPLLVADNNLAPTLNDVEFRVINASINSPKGGVDVYLVPPGADLANYTPAITGLGNAQASAYQPVPYLAGGYSVIITANLTKVPFITQSAPAPVGSITTYVLLDNPGGTSGMSQTPLVLHDLN
ncbi:MAG: DUF4397 domain-containing protein [Terriglobales bacterium]